MWSHLGILGLGGVLHRVLEQVVLLAQLHTLAPPKTIQCKGLLLKIISIPVVTLVQVGGNSSEFYQLVLLQRLSQLNVVKVVKCINARLQALVILLGDQQPIEGLVDGLVVQVLDAPEVRLHQLDVVCLGEEAHCPGVIESWC